MKNAGENQNVEFLTRAAASRKTGLSIWMMKKVIESGELKCLSIGGRPRVSQQEVDRYLREQLSPKQEAAAV